MRSAQDLRGALDALSESVRTAIREAGDAHAAPQVERPAATAAESIAEEPVAAPPAETPEGARIVALNMVLDGKPRDEVAAHLEDEFGLTDSEALLDDVFARVG